MPITQPHPILFERIDGDLICSTALKTDGVAGPSGLDAAAWKGLCNSFKSASTDLGDAVAATARRICTSYVDPVGISALVACQLIALDKSPGVRPIGIGETIRRIIGRSIATTIMTTFKPQLDHSKYLLDICQAVRHLNPQVALQNITNLCPTLSKVLINMYQEEIQLFIDGKTLLSLEGTTQGDPLAMAMYAVAISPLIPHLQDEEAKQIWFADDATAGVELTCLRKWWDCIVELGPNASKT